MHTRSAPHTLAPSDIAVGGVRTDFAGYNASTQKCSAQCDEPRGFALRPDQPFCPWNHFVWGTLGECAANSSTALRLVDAPQFGPWTDWSADVACDSLSVVTNSTSSACDKSPDSPGLCAQWDFVSGVRPTDITVPRRTERQSVVEDQWQIFETGARTYEEQGSPPLSRRSVSPHCPCVRHRCLSGVVLPSD